MARADDRSWSRRRFLAGVGRAGGAAAVYQTATALGFMGAVGGCGEPADDLPPGNGKRVLILGSGIGGLTAAYRLMKAGYVCVILEAQDRVGGRSFTARRGSVIREEVGLDATSEQECNFDPGLYLNLGPGRLPHHHRRVLHYCNELGVDLQVYVMHTTANYFAAESAFGGRRIRSRAIEAATQGQLAELLAKATGRGALDAELSPEDRMLLLDLLEALGPPPPAVHPDETYRGCDEPFTVDQLCQTEPLLGLQPLLDSRFWKTHFLQPKAFAWQPTLFQPVGGMDMIVKGFASQVGDLIRLNSEVTGIELGSDSVQVTCRDRHSGSETVESADYCISNIPLPVLDAIPNNFSTDFADAVGTVPFASTCKVGWQANTRFWENDQNQIYGGISWTDAIIQQIWYPSNDYFGAKGTLTGAYNFEDNARALGDMDLAQRLAVSKSAATILHEEFADETIVPTSSGLSIAWHRVPFQQGGWADWQSDDPAHAAAYSRLLAPDPEETGRFFIVGDQVSTLPGWQEGAMMSAEHVTEQIAGIRPMTKASLLRAPDSRSIAQGPWGP